MNDSVERGEVTVDGRILVSPLTQACPRSSEIGGSCQLGRYTWVEERLAAAFSALAA